MVGLKSTLGHSNSCRSISTCHYIEIIVIKRFTSARRLYKVIMTHEWMCYVSFSDLECLISLGQALGDSFTCGSFNDAGHKEFICYKAQALNFPTRVSKVRLTFATSKLTASARWSYKSHVYYPIVFRLTLVLVCHETLQKWICEFDQDEDLVWSDSEF